MDDFGFKIPLCSENKGFTATGRHNILNLIALNKKQPDWVPKFTKLGFEKTRIPDKVYSKLLSEYEGLKQKMYQESCAVVS